MTNKSFHSSGAVVGAVAIVALVMVPVLGMALAVLAPVPGIEPPPPPTWSELMPLFGRTLGLGLVVGTVALALGSWLAWVEQRAQWFPVRWLALLTVLPLAVPSYLMATILREAMAPAGWLGAILGTEGRFTGFWPAALTLVLATTPYVQLLVGASLRRLPIAQEEAARSLGASPWRRFKILIFPHLRPTWAFALVLVSLYTISDFGAVAVLNTEVLTWELYKSYNNYDIPGAVWFGFGLMALVVPLLALVRLLHGQQRVERGSSGQRAAVRRRLPLAARTATLFLQLAVIGVGVVLPLVALIGWVIDGVRAGGDSFSPIGEELWDSLVFAVLGSSVALVLAMVVAWAAVRHLRRPWWLENAAYLTSSLPGVLVAFGIVQMVVILKRHVPVPWGPSTIWSALEGVGVMVVLGYSMRFLAEGYAALKPALLRLDPRHEESARSLGAGPWRRFWKVTLPSLAPGMGAAYVLLFLAIVKELPITMMLIPTGHTTLAYRIFDAQNEGLLPEIGLAGLVLLSLALSVQVLLLRWRRHV